MSRMSTECQRKYLIEVLKEYDGNVTRAAEHAGIERESFHRLLRKCDIDAATIRRRSAGRS
jgi:DNA-binding NtrC family response regulator